MDNIFPIYFKSFDEVLIDKFNGKVTREFKKLISESKVKLKDSFIHSPKYQAYCTLIDLNFDKYLKDKQ
jgi:hypothetical protein